MESTASEPLTDKPVADESVTEGVQHCGHSVSSRQRRIIISSVIAVVLVLAGGVTGGVFAYQQYEHSQTVKACVKTVTPLQTALTTLHAQQSAKATTELVKLDVKKLADKTTRDALVSAVKPVSVTVASCATTLSTAQLRMNTGKNKRAFTRVKTATRTIASAVDKLVASRTLQSRNVLTAEVKTGRQLVKDSQGKVSEQKTLDQLNTVLIQSGKLVKDKTADYTKLDNKLAEVKKAEQAVRDSVEAKRKADEEATRRAEEERQAQAAAAAQAAQQAQAYRAPAQNYQAPAQRPQSPAQSNGGGWQQFFHGYNDGSEHEGDPNEAPIKDCKDAYERFGWCAVG